MTTKNTGGPAFPFGQISEVTGQPVNGFYDPGMSLRDWFAGLAMQGMLADGEHEEVGWKQIVDAAYAYADAMIAAREAK